MTVLKALILSVIFLSLFVWMGQARAATNVSGTIDQDTTWVVANSPYVVVGGVTVAAGVTLTIEAGVVVKFPGSYLYVDGTLIAQGTGSQPIVLTSYQDDSVGGDTNGDGTASSPAAGDWYYVWFSGLSHNSVLDSVVVRYGGHGGCGGPTCLVAALTSALTLRNSTIERGAGAGVYISGAAPTLTNNVIRNHTAYGLYLVGSLAILTGNTLSGNSGAAIRLDPASTVSTIRRIACVTIC